MDEVLKVPWEQWMGLLRQIAYNAVLAWFGKKPVPIHWRCEVEGRMLIVVGEVRVATTPLEDHPQASDHVQDAVNSGAQAANSAIAEGVANAIVDDQQKRLNAENPPSGEPGAGSGEGGDRAGS